MSHGKPVREGMDTVGDDSTIIQEHMPDLFEALTAAHGEQVSEDNFLFAALELLKQDSLPPEALNMLRTYCLVDSGFAHKVMDEIFDHHAGLTPAQIDQLLSIFPEAITPEVVAELIAPTEMDTSQLSNEHLDNATAAFAQGVADVADKIAYTILQDGSRTISPELLAVLQKHLNRIGTRDTADIVMDNMRYMAHLRSTDPAVGTLRDFAISKMGPDPYGWEERLASGSTAETIAVWKSALGGDTDNSAMSLPIDIHIIDPEIMGAAIARLREDPESRIQLARTLRNLAHAPDHFVQQMLDLIAESGVNDEIGQELVTTLATPHTTRSRRAMLVRLIMQVGGAGTAESLRERGLNTLSKPERVEATNWIDQQLGQD